MEHNVQLSDIIRKVIFNAPIDEVWSAVATSEGLEAWFMPNDFQPIEGNEFHLNAGQFGMSPCKVTKVNPPNTLSFTWGKDWMLTFKLKELEGKTEFTLIHSGWDAAKVTEIGAPHTVVRNNMDKGWTGLVEKSLREYVEV